MLFASRLDFRARGRPTYTRQTPLILINGLAEQAESWYCNAGDFEATDFRDESGKPRCNIFVAGVGTPVALGWEIDDPGPRLLIKVWLPKLDASCLTTSQVVGVHLGEAFLKFERDTLAHNSHRIDRVY